MSATIPVTLGPIRGGSDRLASAVRNVPADRYRKGMSETDAHSPWAADYSGVPPVPIVMREPYVTATPSAAG